MYGQVTQKKIAELCGLSVATVSQILNNRSGNYSSSRTKALVFETARKLGYRKNFVYSLMHGEKTDTVALLVHMQRGMYEEYMRDLIIRLTQALEKRHHACYVAVMGPDTQKNLSRTQEYLSRGVTHFIMLYPPAGYQEISQLIKNAGAALIGIGERCERYVTVDYTGAFRQLLSWVRSKVGEHYRFLTRDLSLENHRCAILRSAYPELPWEELKVRYCRLLDPFDETPEFFQQASFDAGFQTALRVISEEPGVKGFVCMNVAFALGAVAAVRKTNRQVGKDIIITGFNNDSSLRYAPEPVTSIDLNWKNIVDTLVDSALTGEACQKTFPAELIIREIDRNIWLQKEFGL